MTTLQQATMAAKILSDKKAGDVKVIEITDITAIADYFVIATGNNSTHVKALSDDVEKALSDNGFSVSHIEGYRSNSWILMDYVDVIVHIFSQQARDFYDLERLWQDGKVIDFE